VLRSEFTNNDGNSNMNIDHDGSIDRDSHHSSSCSIDGPARKADCDDDTCPNNCDIIDGTPIGSIVCRRAGMQRNRFDLIWQCMRFGDEREIGDAAARDGFREVTLWIR
jgi:hypothetical protein